MRMKEAHRNVVLITGISGLIGTVLAARFQPAYDVVGIA